MEQTVNNIVDIVSPEQHGIARLVDVIMAVSCVGLVPCVINIGMSVRISFCLSVYMTVCLSVCESFEYLMGENGTLKHKVPPLPHTYTHDISF